MLPEARERAVLLTDVHTELHLDLTSTEDFGVEATISFGCTQPGASTFLELNGGTDVTLDGSPAPYADGRIALTDLAASNTVRVTARMPYVTDGDGMTVTIDPADGERYVCAHTSMDIAQKVVPCFDQPDIKSTFTLTVTAPSHWTVLGNGPLEGRTSGDGGTPTDTWTFGTTPPFSSYLFTLVGGPWVSVTWDEPYAPAPGGTLPFGWHARASQGRELQRDADELKRITSACFQHYTTIFEPEYPYADYQQVFAPGLNWGAMEFPGCVVFRDQALTQGTPTELEREWLASTIAHEMAHMWFGDLVTMKWWEDSWLNESFADFMGYDVAGVAAGYTDAWTSAAITRKPAGYRADRRRSTHPIAEDTDKIVDVDTAFANFDMITYAKGNSALAQLGHWLGEEDFLAGVNKHLTAHAFGNADLAAFLDSLDSATDKDVRGWAEAWLRSTGFDTLRVTRDEAGVPVLTREGSRSHRITVSAYDDAMRLVDSRDVHLGGEPVRLEDFAGRVVVPNSGDETFAVVRPDEQSWAAITGGLSSIESQLTRAMLWWTAVDLCESQVVPVGDFVALADTHLRPETHPLVFEGVMRALQSVTRRYASPDEAAGHLAVIADIARGAVEGGDPALAAGASRVLARISADRDFLVDWLGRRRRRPERPLGGRAAARRAGRRLVDRPRGAARQVGLRPPRRARRARRRTHAGGQGSRLGAADGRRAGQPRVRRRRQRVLGLGPGRPRPPLPRALRHRRPRPRPALRPGDGRRDRRRLPDPAAPGRRTPRAARRGRRPPSRATCRPSSPARGTTPSTTSTGRSERPSLDRR